MTRVTKACRWLSPPVPTTHAQGVHLGRPWVIPAIVAERIRADKDAGPSLRSIAEGLDRDGVPTAQGGARWHASTVQGSLRAAEAEMAA